MVTPTKAAQAIPQIADKLWISPVTRVSLKQISAVGRSVLGSSDPSRALLKPAQFLHDELPVRLSHTLHLLQASPLAHSPLVLGYLSPRLQQDLTVLSQLQKPDTCERAQIFSQAIGKVRDRLRENVLAVGGGIQELVHQQKIDPLNATQEEVISQFLDRFYALCLGVDVLTSEHLALAEGRNLVEPIRVDQIAKRVVEETSEYICRTRQIASPPHIQIIAKESCTATHIPAYLNRILFEILLPAFCSGSSRITLVVASGEEDVSIRVSDEGGGFPLRSSQQRWSYLSPPSTYGASSYSNTPYASQTMPTLPTHGLPVARLIARYFGGDLNMVSMEGHGTDTYFALHRNDNFLENIPIVMSTEASRSENIFPLQMR
ncbi:uncharacterized protein VTP21DRAFT_7699 [Calcarisporiella thermophila]|uniref:uncharacterized protein n=1 Tax=Calcarisporiella thermophila TaxID=911321 RepID=UPI003743374A